jgi:hypothetical protein
MAGQTRRRWLAEDARRAHGAMIAVVVDAKRARAEVPESVSSSLVEWREWCQALEAWAEE